MDLRLDGLTAIVTGGTGGIGRATVEVLAEEGCSVGFCARGEQGVRETEAHLEEMGVPAFGRALDVADGPALKEWVDDATGALDGLDIVVANVSGMGSGEGEEEWERAFDIDVMHTVRTVEAALPHLRESEAPAVVIVSTVSAREAHDAHAYGALKAALNHYGKGLARKLAGDGIRVNVVSPGTIYVEDGYWGDAKRQDPERYQQMLHANPLGRMGRPEEVARAVAFLASRASSFTTGTNLLVDGAITAAVQM